MFLGSRRNSAQSESFMHLPSPRLQQSIQSPDCAQNNNTLLQFSQVSIVRSSLEQEEEEEAVFENYTCGNEFYARVIKLKFQYSSGAKGRAGLVLADIRQIKVSVVFLINDRKMLVCIPLPDQHRQAMRQHYPRSGGPKYQFVLTLTGGGSARCKMKPREFLKFQLSLQPAACQVNERVEQMQSKAGHYGEEKQRVVSPLNSGCKWTLMIQASPQQGKAS